jgi:integral membrane protein
MNVCLSEVSVINIFRNLGLLEALSFILLLGIAMPLKYFAGYPAATKVMGMAHGVLFLAYILAASYVAGKMKWSLRTLIIAYMAAVFPLGTIIFDRYYFKSAIPE